MEEPDLAGRRSTSASSAHSQSRNRDEETGRAAIGTTAQGVARSRTRESQQRGFGLWAAGRRLFVLRWCRQEESGAGLGAAAREEGEVGLGAVAAEEGGAGFGDGRRGPTDREEGGAWGSSDTGAARAW
jgi:hypothetical protein